MSLVPRVVTSVVALLLMVPTAAAIFTGDRQSAQASPNHQAAQPTTRPSVQPTAKPILLTDPVTDPRQAGVQWFAPTGHTLRGSFLEYWNKKGGPTQFGYPITEEFVDSTITGQPLQMQYFERSRFEHHPELANKGYEVLLDTLGTRLYGSDPAVSPVPNIGYFPETGHNLSGVFKLYWETHGAIAVQGYPISEPLQERSLANGMTYLVQYFERSRMELHPENRGTAYEVLLGTLGTQLAQKNGYFSGQYPLYSHAPDLSWIAGQVVADPRTCPDCGCDNILYMPHTGGVVLPDGSAYYDARRAGSASGAVKYVIVFGRLIGDLTKGFAFPCMAPGYIVHQLQANPEQ